MLDRITLFLKNLIPNELQRNNFLSIVSNFLVNKRLNEKVYLMNNNKILVDLLKYSFGDYYCYMPYNIKENIYNYRNILKGKRLVLIEESEVNRNISCGYICQLASDDWIYKDFKTSDKAFRINFNTIILCKDYEKFIDKLPNDLGIRTRRIQIIKLDISYDNLEVLKKYNLQELSYEFMNLLIKKYKYNKLIN